MSAFCSKHPKCGCKDIGVYCHNNFTPEQAKKLNDETAKGKFIMTCSQKQIDRIFRSLNESLCQSITKARQS